MEYIDMDRNTPKLSRHDRSEQRAIRERINHSEQPSFDSINSLDTSKNAQITSSNV